MDPIARTRPAASDAGPSARQLYAVAAACMALSAAAAALGASYFLCPSQVSLHVAGSCRLRAVR